jgi:hypothetical protein
VIGRLGIALCKSTAVVQEHGRDALRHCAELSKTFVVMKVKNIKHQPILCAYRGGCAAASAYLDARECV